jgi:hypothetical protein
VQRFPPNSEWLLYDNTEKLYYVIDSELEQQHEELYLSSLKDIKCVVTCDETDKVLVVLLDRQSKERGVRTNRPQFGFGFETQKCDHYNVKIYTNDDNDGLDMPRFKGFRDTQKDRLTS